MAESDRGTPVLTTVIPETSRAPLIVEAFRLEWFTVAWMVIEAAVAIGAGVAAHSITLFAFGIDSLIELASSGVLIWRLTVELRCSHAFAESAEYAARRIGGALLFALAVYVVGAAGWGLWIREGQAFSWSGLLVSLGAMPVMWVLSRRKLNVRFLQEILIRAKRIHCNIRSCSIGQATQYYLNCVTSDPSPTFSTKSADSGRSPSSR
jgi:hypothetical protein